MAFVTVKATGDQLPHIELRFDPGVDYVQTRSYYLTEQALEDPLTIWAVYEAEGVPYDVHETDAIKEYLEDSALGLVEDYEIDFPVDLDKLVKDSLELVTDMLPVATNGDYFPCYKMEVYSRGEPAEFVDYDDEALAQALANEYRK